MMKETGILQIQIPLLLKFPMDKQQYIEIPMKMVQLKVFKYGDVNSDGTINVSDGVILKKLILQV